MRSLSQSRIRRRTGGSSFFNCFSATSETSTVQAKLFPELPERLGRARAAQGFFGDVEILAVFDHLENGVADHLALGPAAHARQGGQLLFQFLLKAQRKHGNPSAYNNVSHGTASAAGRS